LEAERPGPGDYTPGMREEIEAMGEDTFIALHGYMIGAHPGSPESCNCKLSGEENNDFHINLVERRTDRLTQSVVVEMTPKVRAMHRNWTLAALHSLLDESNPPYVRVSSFLLLEYRTLKRFRGRIGAVAAFWVSGSGLAYKQVQAEIEQLTDRALLTAASFSEQEVHNAAVDAKVESMAQAVRTYLHEAAGSPGHVQDAISAAAAPRK
jgi:hypothetical protein